jgi:hypothetical protein
MLLQVLKQPVKAHCKQAFWCLGAENRLSSAEKPSAALVRLSVRLRRG